MSVGLPAHLPTSPRVISDRPWFTKFSKKLLTSICSISGWRERLIKEWAGENWLPSGGVLVKTVWWFVADRRRPPWITNLHTAHFVRLESHTTSNCPFVTFHKAQIMMQGPDISLRCHGQDELQRFMIGGSDSAREAPRPGRNMWED